MSYKFALWDTVGDEAIKTALLWLTLLSDCSHYDNKGVAQCPCPLRFGVGDIMWIVLYVVLGLEEGNESKDYHHQEPDESIAQQ